MDNSITIDGTTYFYPKDEVISLPINLLLEQLEKLEKRITTLEVCLRHSNEAIQQLEKELFKNDD